MGNPTVLPVPPAPSKLYVVFHGLISLVDDGHPESLTAFLIDMGPDHRYMAGTFLNEQTLEVGSHLQLQLPIGRSGRATLDAAQNVVVDRAQRTALTRTNLVHSVMDLPRPDEILYFTQGPVSAAGLAGDTAAIRDKPQFLAGTKVLVYPIDGTDGIGLFGTRPLWVCPALSKIPGAADAPGVALKLAVLHIYNQPATIVDADHNRIEFERSALFLGAQLQLKQAIEMVPDVALAPLGLLPMELACLAHREVAVGKIMNSLRTGYPVTGGQQGGCGSQVCGAVDCK